MLQAQALKKRDWKDSQAGQRLVPQPGNLNCWLAERRLEPEQLKRQSGERLETGRQGLVEWLPGRLANGPARRRVECP